MRRHADERERVRGGNKVQIKIHGAEKYTGRQFCKLSGLECTAVERRREEAGGRREER